MKENPIRAFNAKRLLVFATYNKKGYDEAMAIVQACKSPQWRAGLAAETLVYDRFRREMNLQPLLDAADKADLTGLLNGTLSNFDVTTNLRFKDIDNYVEVSQDRGILYYIALVNLKSEEIEFMPLRFPVCPDCRTFAHHILYLVPPISQALAAGGLSDDQRVLRYCSTCQESEEAAEFSYIIPSVSSALEFARDRLEAGYSPKEVKADTQRDLVSTVRFFERESTLILSALAENGYVVTDPPSGDGYQAGEIHWRHPLAKKLGETIEVYYGSWAG